MARKLDFIDYLCCPRCKKNLVVNGESFVCEECEAVYKSKKGVFLLLEKENLSRQHQKEINYFKNYKDFKNKNYKLEEWHKSFLERFKENFLEVNGKVILDCGTGQGYMALELAKQGAFLIACDLTFEVLCRLRKIAKKKNLLEKIIFICCSAEALPIKSRKIDFFISNAVLEHLEKEKQAIEEISRVCKERAGLMITGPLRYRYLSVLFVPFCVVQDRVIGHLRRYDEQVLREKFSSFGWKPKKIYYSGHFLKVIITKFFTEIFNSRKSAKLVEQIDRRQENKKYGASNICIIFER